jgi:hypothetical protein
MRALQLTAEGGLLPQLTKFSASEFVQRRRPPCPVCGTPIIIDAISNLSLDDRESVMPARCYCPNGHTPRDQQEQA